MKDTFNRYGIEINQNQLEKFEKYYELLVCFNEKFNITAITEKDEVYKKHFIDSLLGITMFNKGTLLDVGSGGGFPAIPLKIMNENLTVTLLEATGKKCEFLKTVIKELGLVNINVENNRAELLAKDDKFREAFDYCTARAVARLNTLCEYCMPFVKVGGEFIAFKGDADEEITEAKNAIKTLGGEIKEIKKTSLDDAKRCFISIKKTSKTPPKYPRGNGKERKNPL